jgi:nicotinate phosphoribosyltransferase
MGVSKDVPSTDMAYKMVEYGGRPVVKLSTDKETLPAEKQVFRTHDKYGCFKDDTIALRKEKAISGASPLLTKVMEKGRRIFRETLDDMRKRCTFSLNNLPEEMKHITDPAKYIPQESGRLKKTLKTVRNRAKAQITKR